MVEKNTYIEKNLIDEVRSRHLGIFKSVKSIINFLIILAAEALVRLLER